MLHLVTHGENAVSEIHVGRGIHATVGRHLTSYARVAVLCQPSTEQLAGTYANELTASGVQVVGYTLPDGEAAKTLSTVEGTLASLVDDGLTRDDAVLSVGGGALTDVGGFIAAVFLRGVDAYYVPTTLLGAVDAAIGGKTAVNVNGKNLAGVFAHPKAVFIDVDTLDVAPAAIRTEGAAEAIKTGFIADPAIVEIYERAPSDPDLEAVVNRSVAVKASVVSQDFRESGVRAILNYGHTIGHGVESVTGVRHGQAVAIGMVAAGAASERVCGFGDADRQRELLRSVGLPVTAPEGTPRPAVMAHMARDKKRTDTQLRMVLLEEIGRPTVQTVDDATVDVALAAVGLGIS